MDEINSKVDQAKERTQKFRNSESKKNEIPKNEKPQNPNIFKDSGKKPRIIKSPEVIEEREDVKLSRY